MLSRYDATQQAMVDCEFAKRYDQAQNAFVDCEFARTYDATQGAWVDKLEIDNSFVPLAFSFTNGGGYKVSDDKRTITFTFKSGQIGVDSASLRWEGKEVNDSVFMGEFETSDSNTNPDVYFYYKGNLVHQSKMNTQGNNLFGIPYSGPVDMIYVNIVPYTASTFSLIRPWFGKNLKFDV